MARMIRKQIVIDAEREAKLAKLAEERGMSQSEVIRLAIDELEASSAARLADEARRREAHEWLMRFFEEGESFGLTDEQGNRQWTRESLYERGSDRH